jgi:hypothetical protein
MPATKPYKAYAAAITAALALIGLHLTSGQAQAIVAVAAALVQVFAVWRTPNPAKAPTAKRPRRNTR